MAIKDNQTARRLPTFGITNFGVGHYAKSDQKRIAYGIQRQNT